MCSNVFSWFWCRFKVWKSPVFESLAEELWEQIERKRILLLEISRSSRVCSGGGRSIRLTTGLSRFQDVEDKLTCTLFRPWEARRRRRPGSVARPVTLQSPSTLETFAYSSKHTLEMGSDLHTKDILDQRCKIQWLRFSISILAARGRSFTLTEGTPRPLKASFCS